MTCFRCNHFSQLFQIGGIYKLLGWLDDTYGLTNQFDERTPEEKAAMLGSVAGLLVREFRSQKSAKPGKCSAGWKTSSAQAAKDALKGIRSKLPDLGPVLQTPEGLAFKAGEIPDGPSLPRTPVQQQYMDAMDEVGGGSGSIEGVGKKRVD